MDELRFKPIRFGKRYYLEYLRRTDPPLWKETLIIKRVEGVEHFFRPYVEHEVDLHKLADYLRTSFPNQREIGKEASRRRMAINDIKWQP